MGKERRTKRKFHLAPVRPKETLTAEDDRESEKMSIDDKRSNGGLSFKFKPNGGVFDGLDIAVDNLNTCLADDAKSVHSLAKTFRSVKRSLGGKSLKKDDKRKLRHDMFLSKIDAFYKNKEMLKKGKNKREPPNPSIKDLDAALPPVDLLFHKTEKKEKLPRPVSTKQRGIKKTKLRQKESVQNFEVLKKMIDEAKSKENLLDIVTDHVQQRVLSEI